MDPSCRLHTKEPQAATKMHIKQKVYEEWTNEWQGQEGANHTKSFYSKPDPHKARFVYKLASLELGRFVRIITGHNNLNFFQHKIDYAPSPECRLCHEGYETLTHLLRDCPATELSRREVLGCLLYTSPSPRDRQKSRMPSSA